MRQPDVDVKPRMVTVLGGERAYDQRWSAQSRRKGVS